MEEIFLNSSAWEDLKHTEGTVYAPTPWALEFIEKFLNMPSLASYECTATSRWDPHTGVIHRFEVEIGPDVEHNIRRKFQERVVEFIKYEIKTILHGY